MEISKEYFAEISNKIATLREEARTLLARIQELETAGRLAYIELENVSNIPVYGWGEEACAAYAGANSKAMEYLAALLNNTPLEKE